MPGRRADNLRLAVGRERHQTAPLLDRLVPESCCAVVTCIGHALGRSVRGQQNKYPGHHQKLAFAVFGLAHHRRAVAGKYRRKKLNCAARLSPTRSTSKRPAFDPPSPHRAAIAGSITPSRSTAGRRLHEVHHHALALGFLHRSRPSRRDGLPRHRNLQDARSTTTSPCHPLRKREEGCMWRLLRRPLLGFGRRPRSFRPRVHLGAEIGLLGSARRVS